MKFQIWILPYCINLFKACHLPILTLTSNKYILLFIYMVLQYDPLILHHYLWTKHWVQLSNTIFHNQSVTYAWIYHASTDKILMLWEYFSGSSAVIQWLGVIYCKEHVYVYREIYGFVPFIRLSCQVIWSVLANYKIIVVMILPCVTTSVVYKEPQVLNLNYLYRTLHLLR